MIAAARARWFSPADDNEADAIAILHWAIDVLDALDLAKVPHLGVSFGAGVILETGRVVVEHQVHLARLRYMPVDAAQEPVEARDDRL